MSYTLSGSLRPSPFTVSTCEMEFHIQLSSLRALAVLGCEQRARWEGKRKRRGGRGEEGEERTGFFLWCKMSKVWALDIETPGTKGWLYLSLAE